MSGILHFFVSKTKEKTGRSKGKEDDQESDQHKQKAREISNYRAEKIQMIERSKHLRDHEQRIYEDDNGNEGKDLQENSF